MVENVKRYTAVGMAWVDSCEYFKCEESGEYSRVDGKVFCCGDGLHATVVPIDALRYCRLVAESRRVAEFWRVKVTETTEITQHENAQETRRMQRVCVARSRVSLGDLAKAQIELMLRPDFALGPQEGGMGGIPFMKRFGAPGTQAGLSTAREGVATAFAQRFGVAVASKSWGVAAASGERCLAAALGTGGAATASGFEGVAVASDFLGTATSTGDGGVAVASGEGGTAANLGSIGVGVASGRGGVALASKRLGDAIAAGEHGVAMAAGASGTATASGSDAIAFAAGPDSWARGSLGNWLVLAERDGDGRVVDVRTAVVDGEQILADTYYALRDGRVVETTEEERKS